MQSYSTEQERFWAGDFGDEYTARNAGPQLAAANLSLFAEMLLATRSVSTVIELGANRGMNLAAMRALLPEAHLTALEINATAVAELRKAPGVEVIESSLLGFDPGRSWDLVLVKGVLIHIEPRSLSEVYETISQTARRYVILCEYYNPTPVSVTYRGHENRLFKRDFAGEFLDAHPEFILQRYGFRYRRDPTFPQDDLTWFLLERKP